MTKFDIAPLNLSSTGTSCFATDDSEMIPCDVLLKTTPDGKVQASRSRQEKEKCPDRISLDRRGLTKLPVVIGEPRLRLLSLQHNLITRLDGFSTQNLQRLVFLDIYDNQLERVGGLETLENLRVLLLGKNRIRRIEGLNCLSRLEVLDLHGNQIFQVGGLSALVELKVLNLAGNQIRIIGASDLTGLRSLQELNLRRNRLKRLLGFGETPQLQKLFLSNNELQVVENMLSVAKSLQLKEITLDGNPVILGGDCVSFLVSHLPQLKLLSHMEVTDAVRKSALLWRSTKESSLGGQPLPMKNGELNLVARREEVISNARTNWELLRSQTGFLKSSKSQSCSLRDLRIDHEPDVGSERYVQSDSGISIDSVSTNPNGADIRCSSTVNIPLTAQKKRYNFSKRTVSQDSRCSTSANPLLSMEFFRLPPILAPLINKSDDKSNSECSSSNTFETGMLQNESVKNLKRWDSLSSVEPNVDSSLSSLPSDTSSGGESDSEPSEEPASTQETLTALDEPTRNIKSATQLRKHVPRRLHTRAATSRPKQKPTTLPGKVREQGGDFLVEITGRILNIYGQGALRFIDRPWNSSKAAEVNTVKFNYINFSGIIPILPRIKQRFPNVENFIFRETNINCLGQLNALADVQGLMSLTIEPEGNQIIEKSWELYAIYRLSHWGLKILNDKEITEEQVKEATEEFQGLSDIVLWSLPESLLQPLLNRLHLDGSRSSSSLSAKQWLFSADPALRAVVGKEALQWRRGALTQEDLVWRHKGRVHLSCLLETACDAIEKLRILEREWPAILSEMVRNTLVDYSHLDSYMKKRIQALK